MDILELASKRVTSRLTSAMVRLVEEELIREGREHTTCGCLRLRPPCSCTRPKGHTGPHVSVEHGDRVVIWFDPPVPSEGKE